MKLRVNLLLFYGSNLDGYILSRNDGLMPFVSSEGYHHSLYLVRNLFEDITGIKDWPLPFEQVGIFEYNDEGMYDDIRIVYVCYLSGYQSVIEGYNWVKISEINSLDQKFADAVRYAAIKRVN